MKLISTNGKEKEITKEMVTNAHYDRYNQKIIVFIKNDNSDGHYTFYLEDTRATPEFKSYEEEANYCLARTLEEL